MNAKRSKLTAADVERYQPPGQVLRHLERLDRTNNLRLLDFGCGRGTFVWWLRSRGWDAHGFEPNAEYVENGRAAAHELGLDPGSLHTTPGDLADGSVDAIYSVQVLEHIANLEDSAAEMRRLLRAGGTGRHIFPTRRTPIEPHVRLPVVHWTDDPRHQRRITGALLTLGLRGWATGRGAPRDVRRDEIVTYLQDNTAYRSSPEVLAILRAAGFDAEVNLTDSRLYPVVGWLPGRLGTWTLATLTNVTIDIAG